MFGLVKESRLKDLQKEYDALKLRLENVSKIELKNSNLNNELRIIKNKLQELKTQISEQNEADLYFVSAKIQKKLLDGEKKENVQDLSIQQIYLQNLLAQAAPQNYGGGFLTGLGLSKLSNFLV
jgi:predicted nuclease with TOPRIM domain